MDSCPACVINVSLRSPIGLRSPVGLQSPVRSYKYVEMFLNCTSITLQFTQDKNEALFVPSGWHHSVENIEDTLSINHNWLNGYNIHWALDHLKKEHSGASQAIDDCRYKSCAIACLVWFPLTVGLSCLWGGCTTLSVQSHMQFILQFECLTFLACIGLWRFLRVVQDVSHGVVKKSNDNCASDWPSLPN